MTTDIFASNKRIAKNTLLLYIRTLFVMLITLYTSRVVLNTLGVTDYGIYNVVGGVILILSFLMTSMGAASSRFITYDLGKGNVANIKKTFGTILTIHIIIAIVILLFGETVGLWFVVNKLQIPADRVNAALWVYQFSIFTSIMSVISVPYNAVIIAHERIKAFAYMGIIDAILKLIIAYLLFITPFDKLIIYAILLFCIQTFDRIVYGWYCTHNFRETRTTIVFNKKQFKEIFRFAVWTMNGNLAIMGYTQGINILLNMFYGPTVNAARGIAVQVQGVVMNFCRNFQMAINPQITKSYARNDLKTMHNLVKTSSKFSFFLLFFISLPLMLEANQVLKWWLGIVPEHTVAFLRLILCSSMLTSLSNPIIMSVQATGKIERFQLIEGTMLLSIVPIAYVLLKLYGIKPEYVFCVHIIVEILTQYIRIQIVLPMIFMDLRKYWKEVIIPIIYVVLLSPIVPIIFYELLAETVANFFIVCLISVFCVSITVYIFGCTVSEKRVVNKKIIALLSKLK